VNKLSVKVSAPRMVSQGSGFIWITFRLAYPLTCGCRYFRSLLGALEIFLQRRAGKG